MRATTVRFGDDLWQRLEHESSRQGLSAAQFVRDSAILRIAFLAAERGDPEARATLAGLAAVEMSDRPAVVPPAVLDPARLRALRSTGLLEEHGHPALDRLARLACRLADAPVALVSLVDADRQVFAGCVGLAEPWAGRRETPLSHSYCQHAVDAREPLVIGDARTDPLLRSNQAITDLAAIAYAGFPLIDADGQALGTLCVIDHRPRTWAAEHLDALRDLAAAATDEIRLITLEAD
jgi:GAF domain-containing protein